MTIKYTEQVHCPDRKNDVTDLKRNLTVRAGLSRQCTVSSDG